NRVLDMPIAADGSFSMAAWMPARILQAGPTITPYIYEDTNTNALIDYCEEYRAYFNLNGGVFGTVDKPLPVFLSYQQLTEADLLSHEKLYQVYQPETASINTYFMREIRLLSNGTARFKYYKAQVGDEAWQYLGDCN